MKVKMLLLWVLITITLIPCYGQAKKTFYSAKIKLQNGDLVKGYLIALHDSSIQIRLRVRPPKDTLFTVDRIKKISLRRRNAPDIGLAVGMGTGIVLGTVILDAVIGQSEGSDQFSASLIKLFILGVGLEGMAVGGILGSIYRGFAIHGDIGLYQNMIDKLPSKQVKKLRVDEGPKLN